MTTDATTPDQIRRPKMPGGPWMTTAEAAAQIGLHPQTLHNMRAAKVDGRPFGVKLGRRVWYAKQEILDYISRNSEHY